MPLINDGGETMEAFSLYLSKLSDYIILIAAVVSALYVIAKPILSAKGVLKKHEKEKFQKQFNAEFDRRAPGCSNQIQLLAEIKELSLKQTEEIGKLTVGIKNVQRQQIMMIYNENKHDRTLEETEKERLDELYRDYKNEGGNSFIDKYYARMCSWETIPDEE